MPQRNSWILAAFVLVFLQVGCAKAQDGLKDAQDLLKQKKYTEAVEAFDALLEKHPDNFDVRMGMAQACYYTGDYDGGGFHAARAQKAKPKDAMANQIMGFCFLAQGHAKAKSGSDPTGLFEQAFEAINTALASNKKSLDLWLKKGNVCYMLGKQADAAMAYENAYMLDKKQGDNAYWAAYFYQAAAKLDKAGDLYGEALSHNVDRRQINNAASGLWNCYAAKGQWGPYLKQLDKWTKAEPKSELAHWWKGFVLVNKPDYKKASPVWKKVEAMNGSYRPEAIYFQGVCAKANGKQDEAIALFSKAAGMRYSGWNPKKHPGLELHVLAGTLFGNGDLEGACKIGEQNALPALRGKLRVYLMRDLGLFFRDWGTALERVRKKEKAQEAFVKSRDFYKMTCDEMNSYKEFTGPWKAQAYNDYALMFHYHFSDLETAIKYYKKAIESDKKNTDACLNLGRIYMTAGKLEEALRIAKQGTARADLSALIRRIEGQMKK